MRYGVFLAAVGCLVSLGLVEHLPAQQRDSTHWLPPEVQGWLSISDLEQLDRAWEQTQLGRLLSSQLFAKAIQAWERQREGQRADVVGLRITWEEIRRIAGGEVALALVHPQGRKPTPVLLVNFQGRENQAADAIRQVHARLQPPTKRRQVELRLHREFSPPLAQYLRRRGNQQRTLLVYFFFNEVLCLTKDLEVAKAIRARMELKTQPNLAADPVFQATMKGLMAQRRGTDQPVCLRWFVRPLGLVRAARAWKGRLLPSGEGGSETEDVDWFEVFSRTGFEQIQGAAGLLTLAGKTYDMEHRIKIYAPRPWKGAVHVLSLYNHQHVLQLPPAWVAGKLASVGRLRLDVLRTFDNIGPLFDQVVADGAEGTWKSSLESIRDDQDGPQVDLREEIMAQLEHDCLLLSAANQARGHDRPRRVVILTIKDTPESRKVVASAIDRYFKPEAKLRDDLIPGLKIWALLPKTNNVPEVEVGPVQVAVGDQHPGVVVPAPKPKPSEPEGVCVYGGHLFYASHLSLLVELLKNLKAAKPSDTPVAQLPDFQRVHQAAEREAQRQGWNHLSFFRFENTAEQFRSTYRLARQNKIAASGNMVIQLLIGLGRLVDENGKQLIDGKLLPPFEKVADQLPAGGVLVHSDPDGWSIVSFVLRPGEHAPKRGS